MVALTTSELARQGSLNVQSIRFYERHGLLPKPPRTASGYRMFPEDAVRRVRFIKRAQALGFTLKEIKELLALKLDPDASCDDVRRRAETKLEQIEQKIRDLRRMKTALATLVEGCSSRASSTSADCAVLLTLERGPSPLANRKK